MNMASYTVKQAAEALGVSPRTLRRRLEAGELSYTRTLRGQRQVVEIDGAELARFAQVNGFTLRQPGEKAEGTLGATEGTEGQTVATEGAQLGALGAERIAALEAQLRAAERERDSLLRIVEDLAEALKVKTLPPILQVEQMPARAQEEQPPQVWQVEQPPAQADPAPAEQPPGEGRRPRSWWSRLWGRGD
jgi:excisionase family DNA binding protein